MCCARESSLGPLGLNGSPSESCVLDRECEGTDPPDCRLERNSFRGGYIRALGDLFAAHTIPPRRSRELAEGSRDYSCEDPRGAERTTTLARSGSSTT